MPDDQYGRVGKALRMGTGPSDSDPSALATAALLREVAILKEQFKDQLQGEVKVLDARISAIDRATVVFEANLNRVPTEVQKEISHLESLIDERFSSAQQQVQSLDRQIALQLTERDVRSDKQTEAAQTAVTAALQAAKEAVAEQARSAALATLKSETAQMKAIEQLGELIQTATAGKDSQIADIKDRLTRIESLALGQQTVRTDQHMSSSFVVAIIAVLVALLSAAATFFHH
jgi:hypothetical protein